MNNHYQMDRILMQNLKFKGHVGVLAIEKELGQIFELDLILYCQQIEACDTDQLTQTVDYSEVYQDVSQIMQRARFDLIERLAGQIADHVLGAYQLVYGIEITIRKPQAPIDGEFTAMAVQIYRERK